MGRYEATSVFHFAGLRIGKIIADVQRRGYIPRAPDFILETEEVMQGVFVQALEKTALILLLPGEVVLAYGILKWRKLEGTINHTVVGTSVV